MSKDSRFETYYEKEDTGKVVFNQRKDCIEEIQKYLDLIEELKKSPELEGTAKEGFEEIHFKLESLKYSEIPAEEVKKKIAAYSRVPLGDGKFLHLSSYLTSTGTTKFVNTEKDYIDQVHKMVKNTQSNLANLLIFKDSDEQLAAFLDDLKSLEGNNDYKEVKTHMEHLNMSGIIKHYNGVKLEFLKSWLAPFEAQLGKPIAELNPKEIQAALAKVESLKKKELEHIGMRLNAEIVDKFRPYNKTMHDLVNGKTTDFWGYPEYRDEFVELVKKVINRFSFKLESHYLVFESMDKSMAFLVGFPDDAFDNMKKLKDGHVGLVPHVKVFFKGEDGEFKEFTKAGFEKNSEFFRALQTSLVPFLASLSTIVEAPLSQGFKDAFNMWL